MSTIESWTKIGSECNKAREVLLRNRSRIHKAIESGDVNRTVTKLLRRIFRNLTAIQQLVIVSCSHDGSILLKLPIGLLVRNCLMDGIIGLRIVKMSDGDCRSLLDLWNRDYVAAMYEQKDVYKDKLGEFNCDDEEIMHFFVLALEDAFFTELDFNRGYDVELGSWKVRPRHDVYEGYKACDGQLKSMKDDIVKDDEVGECVRIIYAYYKYFSQYEHYSDRGNGDASAPFGEDNIRFEKVFTRLRWCLELIIKNLDKD